ncbi:type II toxin-antitoxin system RelE/ParE family toxin [Gellertiella hungarica]|uniref:type II toxin-antitoxin system RelE/ParE family toxin n=1 Tax=Gellertiella hungarica TaxID=1572859 RepID=UPI0031B63B7C
MKSFAFVNAAAERAFRDLPIEIQKQFLFDLSLVQSGMAPASEFKVLKGNWSGVIELIENGSPAYRAVYCAKYREPSTSCMPLRRRRTRWTGRPCKRSKAGTRP